MESSTSPSSRAWEARRASTRTSTDILTREESCMSSRSSWWLVVGGWWLLVAMPTAASPGALRVCADPNNLPFSNIKQEGFENALARLIARELGDTLEYFWWPQRRAWVRHSVGEGKCDVAIGVPTAFEPMTTTRPYYRSTHVFVSRADRHYDLHSLDDPRLRQLRIGLHFK